VPPSTLVDQRIRNRLCEYVEWVCESEVQAPELGLDELLTQWEDFICRPIDGENFPSPAYTGEEIEALRRLDATWERLCDATPASIADERAALALPEWGEFVSTARSALDVFQIRGRLSEDVVVS
jgi:hypothetical protein